MVRGLERFQDRYTLSALLRGRRSLGSRRLECIPFGYGNPETAIKPVLSFQTAYGTSKLVPLRTSTSHRTFSAGCKLVPLRTSTSHRTFSAGCKVVPLRTSTSHRTFSAGCKVVPLRTSTSRWSFSASCEALPFQDLTFTADCCGLSQLDISSLRFRRRGCSPGA